MTAWLAGGDRYISFLKGRTDVAGYFKLFLGCNDVHLAAEESKKLLQGLEISTRTAGHIRCRRIRRHMDMLTRRQGDHLTFVFTLR
ncbi:MAG TPA: hypothetical protein DCP03_02465 [Polaromonas sp.]|uniref:nucleoid-associated protein n=1 Tax=Polaromonas sp. UBA4122 TaxID=1947074 RepID=UPI000EF104B2|nr:hypothetical protein [Polaromonas sp.]